MYTLPPNTPNAQSKAVLSSSPSIAVSASAGSGKTWAITERYSRIIDDTSCPAPTHDILALTFTDAAASEMKQRISSRIQINCTTHADLWVSTIHAFASRIIRECGLVLDINPSASIISSYHELTFWENIRQSVDCAALHTIARTYGSKVLQAAAQELDASPVFNACVSKWGSEKLCALARETTELHASRGRVWSEVLSWAENDDLLIASASEDITSLLAAEWSETASIWSNVKLSACRKGTKDANLLELVDKMKSGEMSVSEFYKAVMTSGEIIGAKNVSAVLGKSLGGWRKTRSQKILKASLSINEPLSANELAVRKVLLKFCGLSWGLWDRMKAERGLLTFSDMITYARKAIAAGGLAGKFRHILVDEYQDTDPLQDKLIKSLGAPNLFVVGDPKQSIYRFRHADPLLFAQTMSNSAEKIELDISYRTRKALLNLINDIFSKLWADGLGKSPAMRDLTYKPLKPAVSVPERDEGTMPVFMSIFSQHDRQKTGQRNLAACLSRTLCKFVSEERTIWDKERKTLRPVKYSDIAILAPTRNIYPILEEELDRFGIPSIRDKSTEYFSRLEISDIVCLLRASADMNDDYTAAGWLLSPFSGVPEKEALQYFHYFDKDYRPIDLVRNRFISAYMRLRKYAKIGKQAGPAELLAGFDRNREWLSAYPPHVRMRVLRNVRYAISLARGYQRSGSSNLLSFAEWLTQTVRSQVSCEEPSWHDGTENAVRLGTVHSAKGLEYPVTVVFDQRTSKNENRSALRASRKLGLVFTNLPDELGQDITPKLADWEGVFSEQGEAEEQKRLFYVAMTRAQDSLIFCGMVNAKKQPHPNTWTQLLSDNMPGLEPIYAEELPPHVFPDNEHGQQPSLKPVPAVKAVKTLRQISASSFALYEWCPHAWRRKYRQGLPLEWDDEAEDYDEYFGGAEVGSLVHWVLERWPSGVDDEAKLAYYLHDPEALDRLPVHLHGAWRRNARTKPSQVEEWLRNFAATELGQLLKSRPDIQREKRFRLAFDEYTSLAGAIDAVYDDTIIDYKITDIDRVPSGLYDAQLEFYALARHMMTDAPSVKTYLVYLRQGEVERREITDFDAIRARVKAAARECVCEPYSPKCGHCVVCPFKKGCTKYEH